MLSDYHNRISSRSVFILEQKIKQLFNNEVAIFCDTCDLVWPSTDVINVVFFGKALHDLSSYLHFPRTKKYIIWVLCKDIKRRLIKYFGFNPNTIKVINRYDLFPLLVQNERKDFHQYKNFIYSARPSSLKNFKLSCELLNRLGLRREEKICLEVYAPHFKQCDFAINEYSNLEVIFMGDKGVNWHKTVRDVAKKCLIQLSIDPIDDFNVSTAQWEAIGGAVLASYAGPYKDLKSENIFHIDVKKIFHSIEDSFSVATLDNMIDNIKRAIIKSDFTHECLAIDYMEISNIVSNTPTHIIESIQRLNCYELHSFTRDVLDE